MLLFLMAGLAWSQPVIKIDENANGAVVVEGLAPELLEALSKKQPSGDLWKRTFQVYLGKEPPKGGPSMIGAVKVEAERLVFMPFFPMLQGREHVVRFHYDELASWADVVVKDAGEIVTVVKTKGPADQPSTSVTKIYPSGEKLPANLSKFYLHFTHPMNGEDLRPHLVLIDEISGEPVKDPFLKQTAWSEDRKRATLFLTDQENTSALKPGRAYVLEVKNSANDTHGQPLRDGFRHNFRTGALDQQSPDTKEWLKNIPEAGSRDLLAILFDESLDRVMVDQMITLKNPEGKEVEGTITVGEDERVWVVNPKRPWAAGAYQMVIDPKLVDVAGNQVKSEGQAKPVIVNIQIKL